MMLLMHQGQCCQMLSDWWTEMSRISIPSCGQPSAKDAEMNATAHQEKRHLLIIDDLFDPHQTLAG